MPGPSNFHLSIKIGNVEIAKKSRDFVERWHDPLKIAERIKNDIENALKNKL